MKKIIFAPLSLFFFVLVSAQSNSTVHLVQADTLKGVSDLRASTLIFIDSTYDLPVQKIPAQHFIQLDSFHIKKGLPGKFFGKNFYTRFSIHNSSPYPRKYFYYPGKLFRHFQLFTIDEKGLPLAIKTKNLAGIIPIEVPAGKTTTFLLQSIFFKTYINSLHSIIVTPDQLEDFRNDMYGAFDEKKIIGVLLSGMLLMIILATLLNYVITSKVEFLFNSIYSLCMFLLIFFTTYLSGYPGWFRGFFLSYLDLFLLILGTIAYLAFTRYFLNTKTLYPKLNKFLYLEAWLLAFLMVAYSILHIGFNYYSYEIIFENFLKLVALAAGLVYIYLSLKKKNVLMNYLAIGASTQIFFFTVSLVLGLVDTGSDSIYVSPFFYFEIGVVCSIIFFLLGLFYKNRQELTLNIREQEAMKLEVEKQHFEHRLYIYKAQEEERNRISADMHDDLGAGMTSIRLYSELAKSKSTGNILPEIEKISSSADELINNMNAIIWSMSSHNDSLANMVAYIRSYCIDYFENTSITPYIEVPEKIPAMTVNGSIRRNVFLVVKEALQNVMKHSWASKVTIILAKEREGISLVIHDNGKGIDFDNIRQFSNGLKNMQKRMKDVDIEFSIENDNGTKIKLYRKTR